MDIVAWTVWAWVLGVVGLGVAVFLRLSLRGGAAAEGARLDPGIRRGINACARREGLVLAAFVVVAGVLLGWAMSPLAGVAFLTGAVAAAAAAYFGLLSAAAGSARAAGDRPLGPAFAAGSVLALTVASLLLLGLGLWYTVKGAGAITDADFQAFAALVAGFALGGACVALFARIAGAVHAGIGPFAGMPAEVEGAEPIPPEATALAEATGGILARIGGTGAELVGSLAGGVVAAMALGAGVPQYASSRQAALALPLLLVLASLLATLLSAGSERLLRRGTEGSHLRLVALVAIVLFLLLSYGIVRALGFEIVDPTGARVFRPTAPFMAVLAGSVAALLVGLVRGIGWGRRRAAPGAEATGGLPLGAAVAPALLVALATWTSYFLAGLYGVGIAAVAMVATAALGVALDALSPIVHGALVLGREAGLAPEALAPAEALHARGARASAMASAMLVAGGALTGISLLAAFASLIGLPEGVLDLLDAPVLPGLMIGVALPYAFASSVLSAIRRARRAAAAEAHRQLSAISGLARGRASADVAAASAVATAAALRGTIVPALLAIVLPVLAGMLSLTLLGGLLAGTILTGFVLAASAAASEGPLAAAAPALDTLSLTMTLVALALAVWLAGVHGVTIPAAALREAAAPLLALLRH